MGKLNPELDAEYPIWRLVLEKSLSLKELETWTLTEIMKANAILDMKQDYEAAHNMYIEKKDSK